MMSQSSVMEDNYTEDRRDTDGGERRCSAEPVAEILKMRVST